MGGQGVCVSDIHIYVSVCIKIRTAYAYNAQEHTLLLFTDRGNIVSQELVSHLPSGLSI